jgi:phosphate starvation-inducible membrane PsiE
MTALNSQIEELAYSIGNTLVNIFHLLALFAIGGVVVWSAVLFSHMIIVGQATVEDILHYLFI